MKRRLADDEIEKTYFIPFENSRETVGQGSLITLIMGDLKQEDLVVE